MVYLACYVEAGDNLCFHLTLNLHELGVNSDHLQLSILTDESHELLLKRTVDHVLACPCVERMTILEIGFV